MLLSIGEILLDTFIKSNEEGYDAILKVGGAPFNLAARVSLKGVPSSFYGAIGDDLLGKMASEEAKKYPLSACFLKRIPRKSTTLAVVTLLDGERSFDFLRKDETDCFLDIDDLKRFSFSSKDIVHFGSLLLTNERGYRFLRDAIDFLKPFSSRLSFDMNVRKKAFFEKDDRIKERYRSVLKEMDFVKASDEDFCWLTSLEPSSFKKDFLKKDSFFFLTHGQKGSEAYFEKEGEEGVRRFFVPSLKVKSIDTTGAGDAFYASILTDFLRKADTSDLASILLKANREGALATTYKGALPKVK